VNALFAAAVEIQAFCREREWRCCVIGGLAVQRWGEPRQTRDVDLTLLTGLGGETRYIDPLIEYFRPRITDAREFALAHRVVLVETGAGIPLDISLAALPFEERVIERASSYDFDPIAAIATCSAEDLVVLKAFAGRPQDWLDIEGIVVRQTSRLNRALVLEELKPLLELNEDLTPESKLQDLFVKHSIPST
jgi:hypothetical protein